MSTRQRTMVALAGVAGALALAACSLDVPDLNNPGLDELADHPTAALVTAACTGLVIEGRRNVAAENGLVSLLGILGREAYNFDTADPRYITEMLGTPLNKASPFGGNFWAFPYTNIRLANIILHGVDKVGDFSATEKAAIRGFVHTIQAIDLLEVIATHDTIGAVIDTDRDLPLGPGAIVDQPTVYAEIVRLLDDATPELDTGGASFPFVLSSGYHDAEPSLTLDTPAGFRKVNRAIRARVAAYLQDYPGVLTALAGSFLDDTSATLPLGRGVYHVYSTKTGDVTNGLINSNIYAHPSLETDARLGALVDARYTAKIGIADKPAANAGLSSSLNFSKLYPSPSSPVAMIRNEELILLKAEARFFTGDVAGAVTELNLVRVSSGGLPPLVGTPDATTFVDDLLYERRYSLMFEGGHRWIDLRRFGRPLALDRPADVRSVRFPIPQDECDARPDEPACTLISSL